MHLTRASFPLDRIPLILCLSLISGCDDFGLVPNPTPEPIAFESLPACRGFTISTAGADVIRADSVYQRYWRDYRGLSDGYGNKTPPPSIDFAEKMVLCVHYGTFYSGCSNYVEVVERVGRIGDTITVTVARLPDLGPCRMVVSPIQMVTIPQSSLKVVFAGEVPG